MTCFLSCLFFPDLKWFYLCYTCKLKTKSIILWNSATEIKPFQKCIFSIKFQNKFGGFDQDKKKIQEKNSSLKPRLRFHLLKCLLFTNHTKNKSCCSLRLYPLQKEFFPFHYFICCSKNNKILFKNNSTDFFFPVGVADSPLYSKHCLPHPKGKDGNLSKLLFLQDLKKTHTQKEMQHLKCK